MKLRYYLRGLAVGILVTTLVLTIANRNNRPLTDAQIRERALQLGMEDGTEKKLSALAEGEGGTEPTVQAPESVVPDSSTPESTEPESVEPESSVPESTVPESESAESTEPESKAPESAASESKAPESKEPESKASESSTPETPAQEVKPVTITIPRGASSYSVSKSLAAAGLVEDAASYDAYLCNNGYSRSIHVGTYQIMPGSSEKEIAEIIAR